MPAKVCIVHNAGSGRFDESGKIKQAFKTAGLTAEIIELDSSLPNKIKSHLDDGYKTFVASGGDGTINALAGLLYAKTGVVMGVLPEGTFNHFAKDLQIPLDLDAAIKVIAAGQTTKIDVGLVNDQLFLNNSSIGIYARVARNKQRHSLWLLKNLRSVSSGLWYLLKPPVYELDITINDQQIKRKTPFVFVGNNDYKISKIGLFERTSLKAGTFSVYLIKTRNPFKIVWVCLQLLAGQLPANDFEEYKVKQLVINSGRKKVLVAYDGETQRLASPISYKLLPQQMSVIIP